MAGPKADTKDDAMACQMVGQKAGLRVAALAGRWVGHSAPMTAVWTAGLKAGVKAGVKAAMRVERKDDSTAALKAARLARQKAVEMGDTKVAGTALCSDHSMGH